MTADPWALPDLGVDEVRDALTTGTVRVVHDRLASVDHDYFTAAVVLADGTPLSFTCGSLHHSPGAAAKCVRPTGRRWAEWADADVTEVSPGVIEIKRENGQPGRWQYVRVHVSREGRVVEP